jgi:hypothetical protein
MTREQVMGVLAKISGWVVLALLWGVSIFLFGAGLGLTWQLAKGGWKLGTSILGI